jgi:tetratricopeptide (TPR) repeat protein
MMAERDHLVTKVFPALRRCCEERDVTFQEIDPRWGISEEEAGPGKVADVCLKEIQKATPFFIGLLGDRCGTSITEIEIQEGVLRSPEKVNAYFYFRSPKMEVVEDYKEKPGSREAEKLAALKQKIRDQRDYPAADYDSIEHLGDLVEQDFKALVDRLFPQAVLSPLEKERLEQRVILKSKTGVYVPNPAWFEKLDEFAQSNGQALVVTGENGMGKSALLANWIANREERPEEKLLYHFIGNSQSGGDYRKITQRLIDEVRDIYHLPAEPEGAESGEDADKPDNPREILQNLLSAVPRQERLIVILDGMDQLSDIDSAKVLNWLPVFPQNVKFIFSTGINDPTREVFVIRNYKLFFPIEALPLESRKRLVAEYLASFGKGLSPAQVDRIAADPKSENPFLLRTLLDELRVFGVHERIDEQIDHYLAAPDQEGFFSLVLERLEKTYAVGDYNLVRDVFSLVAVSRGSFSEAEIVELSGVAPRYWSWLFNGVVNHYNVIGKAVRRRYLSQDGAAAPYRRRIVAYMEQLDNRERKYEELPWQLCELGEWDRLCDFLLDFDVFEYMTRNDNDVFEKYWRTLQEVDAEKYSIRKYLDLKTGNRSAEAMVDLYFSIGDIARHAEDYSTALEYCQRSLEMLETIPGENILEKTAIYHALGGVYESLNDYPKALEYHRQALEMLETTPGENIPYRAVMYHTLGGVYESLNDYPKALEYHRQGLEIREAFFGKNHAKTEESYKQIRAVYIALKDSSKVREYDKQILEIGEAVFGKNHPHTAYEYQYLARRCLDDSKDVPGAIEYYKQTLNIMEASFGRNHLITAGYYNRVGGMYESLKDYPHALEYYKQELEIRKNMGVINDEEISSTSSLAFNEIAGLKSMADTKSSCSAIGRLYTFLGDHLNALEYFKQALEAFETAGFVPKEEYSFDDLVAPTYYVNVANTYHALGDYPKALEYYKQWLELTKTVYGKNHPNTATAYDLIAGVYCYDFGDYSQAIEHYRQAVEIQEIDPGKNNSDTAEYYNHLGHAYYRADDYANALKSHLEALEIRKTILGEKHSATAMSYNNAGSAYFMADDYANALKYHREALEIIKSLIEENVENVEDDETAMAIFHFPNNIAMDYEALGETDQALAYYRQALAVYEAQPEKNSASAAEGIRKRIEALTVK